ncbi:lysine transporter LysE [Terrihabitans soli]|uniref:Lysine transporter LysE n=1 Tax=Terrihabitans soli TaxID=708113 RepID=A0A6S6QT33_9HYPH|nr:LysE family transporter [Terrihabitans soli]BCJ90211.1 lysine transporter LysE [Terrihabitans soli]
MLDWALLAIGFGIGFAMAAPMGPINIMVIHRGVRHGFMSAFIAGLGAVAGDTLYAAIAAFGITSASDLITGHLTLIKIVGGLLLIGFGLSVVPRTPHPEEGVEEDVRPSMFGAAVSSFVMCVTNPALLLGFAAVFSGLDEIGRAPDNYKSAFELTLGVLTGGIVWWFLLASTVARFRHRITVPWLRSINIIAGVALMVFGGLLLADVALNIF